MNSSNRRNFKITILQSSDAWWKSLAKGHISLQTQREELVLYLINKASYPGGELTKILH